MSPGVPEGVQVTPFQKKELLSLHYRAVKAAQAYEAATPGTQTKRTKEIAWERAEQAFRKAVDNTLN